MPKNNNKTLLIIGLIVLVIFISNQQTKKEYLLSSTDWNSGVTGQFIGGDNDDYLGGLGILQLPQGIQPDLINELNQFITSWNQGVASSCPSKPNVCGCSINVDTSKLYNFANCQEVRSTLNYAVNKFNDFRNICELGYEYNVDLSYNEILINGKQVSVLTITEMPTDDPRHNEISSIYGYCNDANNRIMFAPRSQDISNYMNYYSANPEPSTLNGYVPYLMQNYQIINGNTNADVCRLNTDCTGGNVCKEYFCVPEVVQPYCGDNSCNNDENCASCATDCACASDKTCSNNACVTNEPLPEQKEWYENPIVWVIMGGIFFMIIIMSNK